MKDVVKKTIGKIKKSFFSSFNLKKTLLLCVFSLLIFTTIFPIGSLSNNTISETCANYFADISKKYTNEVGSKKLSGLIVEPKDGEDAKMRRDTEKAITDLWGVFKGNNASFAPVMNANKENNIYFDNEKFSEKPISLVYTYDGQSSVPYHKIKDKNGEEKIVDYKFQSSPIALMFPSALSGITDELHIYISQSQAERRLEKEGVTDITYETLKGLLNTSVDIKINGAKYKCIIDNIYLDNFEHSFKFSDYDYYYASDIETVIDDFVFVILTHINRKKIILPADMKEQSLYIMSEYSFRNKFYLEYAKEAYSPDNYTFKYAESNLKEGFNPDPTKLSNALVGSTSDYWCTVATVFVVLLFTLNLVLVFLLKMYRQPFSLVLIFAACFTPFLFFKILNLIINDTFIFSNYSLILTLIMLIVFAFSIILFNLLSRKIVERVQND